MGVPGFFAWILKNFKKQILSQNLKKRPKYFYVDANCLFHPECFKVLDYFIRHGLDSNNLQETMFQRITNYLDYLENFVNPTDTMYISVDGTAPLAKISQQRKRRFKSVLDTKIRNEIKQKHGKAINDMWSNVVITPGTKFMEDLHNHLNDHYSKKSMSNKKKYIYSSYHTPGEGEHKILQHIKNVSGDTNDAEGFVVYGLDADLIFLAMASGKNNIWLLREETHFGLKKDSEDNELFDVKTDVSQELIFVSIDEVKKAYNREIHDVLYRNINKIEIEDIDFSDDLIFICFLLGNDFLPHFPSIDIHRGGLDDILTCYVNVFLQLYSAGSTQMLIDHHNKEININMIFLALLTEELGKREPKHFRYDLPKQLYFAGKKNCFSQDPYQIDIWNLENMRNDKEIFDPVKLGVGNEDEWKFRYYEHYFHTIEHQDDTIKKICEEYMNGINWVTKYYFDRCVNWRWQYPFDNAPFISDLGSFLGSFLGSNSENKGIVDTNIVSDPIPTMVQLLSVMPPQHSKELPKSYAKLVSGDSTIIDMFPLEIEIDTLYKTQQWQCVPKIPYLNVERVIIATRKQKLDKQETKRSETCEDFIY